METPMKSLTVSDGTEIWFATYGDPSAPAILLGPHFYPDYGRTEGDDTSLWIDGLKDEFYLILADYPRGFGRTGNPLGLEFTPDVAAEEYDRIAEAAGALRYGWIGYSYGGAMGVQQACRSERVTALAVGGFPPLNAPYREMIEITRQVAETYPATAGLNPKVLLSAVGFYSPLAEWPERSEVAKLAIPRMTFMGAEDVGVPAHGVDIPLADRVRAVEVELKTGGWQVEWLMGADHLGAIQAAISLPVVRDFFRAALLA